jgi:general secretion pathway protein D/MSHA biogenesis protein MshL
LETVRNPDGSSTSTFQTAAVPFGPVLEIVPHVSADSQTVQLSIIATVTEFLGYEKADPDLEKLSPKATLPLPQTRIRQANTAVNIRDGQTVVLGGLISEETGADKNTKHGRKNLLVFVTPRVINDAGDPVNMPAGK